MFTKLVKIMLGITMLLNSYVAGYPSYNANVPNGNLAPPSAIELGHPMGATKRYTAFANAYTSGGRKWTVALCRGDADGDGQSNGLELGDPCCVWTVGAAPRFMDGLSDPNNPGSLTKNNNQSCA